MIADMHCHLDLYPDYLAVAEESAARGVWVLAVTTTPTAWKGTRDRLRAFPNISVAIGLHPELAHLRQQELRLMERQIPGVTFIGEIGLDGSTHLRAYATLQQSIFKRILRSCELAGGRILSIHSRRASAVTLECLEQYPGCGVPILHWFNGSKRDFAQANRMDCWFSVGPPMLSTPVGIERVLAVPRNRLLLETDGPFAKIDDMSLKPVAVFAATEMLAKVWQAPLAEVQRQLEENQRTILRLAGI